MGGHRRRRRNTEADTCGDVGCEHEGRCVHVAAGVRACACTGAWGGARCTLYVGHDHACRTKACAQPALCVWGPDVSGTEAGAVRCVCPVGELCAGPSSPGPVGPGATGDTTSRGAWGAAAVAVALLAALLGALYLVHRRRRSAFVHARLSDNVEINNPMYLAGGEEEEPEPGRPPPRHGPAQAQHVNPHHNGSRQFANPVYEELYHPLPSHLQPQQHGGEAHRVATPIRSEEHAILLREGSGEGSPPLSERTERLALL